MVTICYLFLSSEISIKLCIFDRSYMSNSVYVPMLYLHTYIFIHVPVIEYERLWMMVKCIYKLLILMMIIQ